MQPKKYHNPTIALLNVKPELKAEKDNAEIKSPHSGGLQAIVRVNWNILCAKLERIHYSVTEVILSKLPIGDVATQYFADGDKFCASYVPEEELKRSTMACRGLVQDMMNVLSLDVLGHCQVFGLEVKDTISSLVPQGHDLHLYPPWMNSIWKTQNSLFMIIRETIKNDSVGEQKKIQ